MTIKLTWRAIGSSRLMLVLFLVLAGTPSRVGCEGQPAIRLADGCELLNHPERFNGREIIVDGLVYSDFEHFDLRLKCAGYIQLLTSVTERDVRKYGFKTVDDKEMKELMRRLHVQGSPLSNSGMTARATIRGLFRCHYDFPDCKDISRYGDSSIIIKSVSNVRSSISEASRKGIGSPSKGRGGWPGHLLSQVFLSNLRSCAPFIAASSR